MDGIQAQTLVRKIPTLLLLLLREGFKVSRKKCGKYSTWGVILNVLFFSNLQMLKKFFFQN